MITKTFEEYQRFNQWWVWTILIGVALMPLIAIGSQTFTGKPFGDKPLSNTNLFIVFISLSLLAFLMSRIQLQTKISSQSIHFYFMPFVKKTIPWATVATAKVVNYGFVGGWGIRLWTSYGTVYNIRGCFWLALTLKNGKKILIGTQKEKDLAVAIKNLNL